jgi:hypothetical protein
LKYTTAVQLVVFLVLVGNYHVLSYIQNCVGIPIGHRHEREHSGELLSPPREVAQ